MLSDESKLFLKGCAQILTIVFSLGLFVAAIVAAIAGWRLPASADPWMQPLAIAVIGSIAVSWGSRVTRSLSDIERRLAAIERVLVTTPPSN